MYTFPLQTHPSATAEIIYSDPACTVPATITDLNGNLIAHSQIEATSFNQRPQFLCASTVVYVRWSTGFVESLTPTPESLNAAQDAANNGTFGPIFAVVNYGTVDTTGATDSSTAVLAALAACHSAGGGKVVFPAGTIRIDSQIAVPNDGSSTQPTNVPMTLVGQGSGWSGTYADTNRGRQLAATTLDLRYSGADAQIVTVGTGLLQIRDIQFQNLSSALITTPFILTTNTTLRVEDCAFVGYSSLSGTSCVQDAIILGGTSGNYNTNLTTGAFGGYGTLIHHNYFSRVRYCIYANEWAESNLFSYNFVSEECGGDAPFYETTTNARGTAGTASNYGNIYLANRVALRHYTYAWDLTGACKVTSLGDTLWDTAQGAPTLAVANLNKGTQDPSGPNWIGMGTVNIPQLIWFAGDSISSSYAWSSAGFSGSAFFANQIVSAYLQTIGPNTTGGYFQYANSGNPTSRAVLWMYQAAGNAAALFDPVQVSPIRAWGARCLRTGADITANRPSASAAGSGSMFYDTTLSKPIWSDGTTWRDATGTAV